MTVDPDAVRALLTPGPEPILVLHGVLDTAAQGLGG